MHKYILDVVHKLKDINFDYIIINFTQLIFLSKKIKSIFKSSFIVSKNFCLYSSMIELSIISVPSKCFKYPFLNLSNAICYDFAISNVKFNFAL